MSTEERRSVNDLSGSNLGDYSARDAAGRDIVHQGMDPGQALAFVRDYIFTADQERERQIGRLADALELHEISERQRRVADAQARRTRQIILDIWLALLTLAVLALVWHAFGLPPFAAAIIRAWIGAGLALSLSR